MGCSYIVWFLRLFLQLNMFSHSSHCNWLEYWWVALGWYARKLVPTSKSDKAQVKFVSQGSADTWLVWVKQRIWPQILPRILSQNFPNHHACQIKLPCQTTSDQIFYQEYNFSSIQLNVWVIFPQQQQDDETYPWGHRQEWAFWRV